jgi:hypothetical protein
MMKAVNDSLSDGHVELEERMHHVAADANLERIDDVDAVPAGTASRRTNLGPCRHDATRREVRLAGGGSTKARLFHPVES